MDWILRSPQIYSTFGSLGYTSANGYHVNENCDAALETILQNILNEDKYLRSYRRCIRFAQNIEKDLIPLLLHCETDKTRELLIRVLVNLTIPVECLLVVDAISRSELENLVIFEINHLLTEIKTAFADKKVTKAVIDFLKKNLEGESAKLSMNQCTNISNSLLLLRNILHIPDENGGRGNHGNGTHSMQNQILWNTFEQSLDKVLIKLMTIPEAANWAVTMVQLIALLYKDQHASTLHRLLNVWLESSVSTSSEDNESNTSNPDRGSANSSPCLTSDPTSDSSETGSGKRVDRGEGSNCDSNGSDVGMNSPAEANAENSKSPPPQLMVEETTEQQNIESNSPPENAYCTNENVTDVINKQSDGNGDATKITMLSETSDCGYGTLRETRENSTSSNDDEMPFKKPIHKKHLKPKVNVRSVVTPHDIKRKKFVKRGKAINLTMNFQGLLHNTPTDEDISNILKEFTVDFLLKGYNSLVQTLHNQILTNMELEIETSHFFWLVTYFLKFATQIELDLEYISSVLSFEIVSYFTAEGVNLCEQFELTTKLEESNLKPIMRRLHLVVTGIREFVQAVEAYEKFPHTCDKGKDFLAKLTLKMSQAEELHCLLVLLLRYYNQKYYTKQYLQDLIVTNHVLLTFLDRIIKKPDGTCSVYLIKHLRQFTAPEVMRQYGLLLEDYLDNGEFVNDCILNVMHHVGGELGSLKSLYQPRILNTFVSIWRSDFELCDDWSDLIETAINTTWNKPQAVHRFSHLRFETPCSENTELKPDGESKAQAGDRDHVSATQDDAAMQAPNIDEGRWMENENSSWRYLALTKEMRDNGIRKLCEQLNEKSIAIDWLQKVLLETCFVKIYFEKKVTNMRTNTEIFGEHLNDLPVMSSVAWLALLNNQAVPLVPWNCEQAAVNKDVKFLQLVHLIGFLMPVDMGKIFIRIPNSWTSEFIYEVATMLGPVDADKLKFSLSDISGNRSTYLAQPLKDTMDDVMTPALDSYYQMNKPKLPIMVTYTPSPISPLMTDTNDTATNWLEIVKKSQMRKLVFEIGCMSTVTKANDDEKCDVNIGSEPCPVQPSVVPAEPAAMDWNNSS